MQILLAGGSGFLGTALRETLTASDHDVIQLVRSEPASASQVKWDPYGRGVDLAVVAQADAVVNLAGAPLAHWPWTASYRKKIVDSRVRTTRTLAEAVAATGATTALVNASGINYYGSDRGDEKLDEHSAAGGDFLGELCRRWEEATHPAAAAGARVAVLRTAVVLDGAGGALKSLLIPFRLGLGGRLGTGRQWIATVSLHDYLAAATRILTDAALTGPFNVVAPVPARNREFTAALGTRLHRPTRMTVPSFALRSALGDFGATLTGGVRVAPRRLLDAGFEFSQPTIESQLDAALG